MVDMELEIVEGRVLAVNGARITVEFGADALEGPGCWLGTAAGGMAEVIARLNPTEWVAAVRQGAAPRRGEVCERLGAVGVVVDAEGRGALSVAHGAALGPMQTAAALSAVARGPERPARAPIAWGHPGLDVLAPILDGESCLWSAAHGLAEPAISAALGVHLAQARGDGARVVWVDGSGGWPGVALLASPPDLRLGAGPNRPGALAALPRLAASVVGALLGRGESAVCIFVVPEAMVAAFGEVDGAGGDGRVAGVEALQLALGAIGRAEGPARHVIGLEATTESWALLSSTASAGLEGCFSARAGFEAGRMVMADTWSPQRHGQAIGERRRAVAEAIGELTPLALGVDDFAAIFGEEEMEDAQRDVMAVLGQLAAWLELTPKAPVPVDESVERAAALVLGALPATEPG